MSITFWAPDAPTFKTIPYPDMDPDFEVNESVLPEINMSNTNALRLLAFLDETVDYCGTWEVCYLPDLLAKIQAKSGQANSEDWDLIERSRSLSRLVNEALTNNYSISWG